MADNNSNSNSQGITREELNKLLNTPNRSFESQLSAVTSKSLDEAVAKAKEALNIAQQQNKSAAELKPLMDAVVEAAKNFNTYARGTADVKLEELERTEQMLIQERERAALLGEEFKYTEELASIEKRRATIETTLQKSREANVAASQKMADYARRTKQRNEAHEKNEREYNDTLAALEGDKKAKQARGEWTDEDQKQFDRDKAAAEEKKEKAEAKSERETGVQLGGMQDVLGQVLGSGGAVGKIVDGISGIINIVDLVKAAMSGNPIGLIVKLITKIVELVAAGFKKLGEGIEMYANVQTEYLGKVNSRLMGTDLTFEALTSYFSVTFGSNPYVNQKSLIESMAALVESGVAYNLEQRTILSELSDRMVSTFDMLDSTLLRLTRLQQADMSVASMGNEGLLTTFLNENFEDSSYMSDMYDTVAAALIDATAQMDAKSASEFNYAVQKWLGSLYSLGMSSEGINTLLEGIGYLATGNVEAFNSNDSLRTLFAMASGGSYSDLLVGGLNSVSVNTLLNNIVTYLANIYGDTNKVVEQTKAGVFGGLSLSDIRAAYNTSLSASTISAESTNWGLSTDYVQSTLLKNAEANTAYATQIDNLIENTLYTIGEEFVNSTYSVWPFNGKSKYYGWRIGEEIGGAFGTAIQGITAISEIYGIISRLGNSFSKIGKGLDELGSVNISDNYLIKTRGNTYTNYTGAFTGLSASTVYRVEGTADQALSNTYYENEETITNASNSYSDYAAIMTRDISDLYQALFEEQLPIRVILADVENKALTKLCINDGHVSIYAVGGVLHSIASFGASALSAIGDHLANSLTNSVAKNGVQTWDVDPDSVAL